MMAVVVEDGGGRGRWQRRTTIAAEDNGMQDRAADYNGEGKEWMAKEGGDNGVAMMAAAAEGDGGGRWWQRWMMTATEDNNSGGRQMRQMMTACKIKQWTTRGKEESGRQTRTTLGQPGRERETKIKKSSLCKKTFFSNTICPIGVFAPAKNQLSSF
jgi:hypothetical protein